jgi:hypothetical protein
MATPRTVGRTPKSRRVPAFVKNSFLCQFPFFPKVTKQKLETTKSLPVGNFSK